jgi:hypothetical protein
MKSAVENKREKARVPVLAGATENSMKTHKNHGGICDDMQ